MKIALVVPGRFHAFDLARALLLRGHEVTVFTNYPKWAARRLGLPERNVRSNLLHGILARVFNALGGGVADWWSPVSQQVFGRWAARRLRQERWDVIHCWSGVSEESLTARAGRGAFTLLMRGSAHVATQRRLLDEESKRVASSLDRPSDWILAREAREYALCDHIAVLSAFAKRSFEEEGVPPGRVSLLPLGVEVGVFKADPQVLDERRHRILSGEPIRVLYCGAVSYRKGVYDLARTIDSLAGDNFAFTVAGEVTREATDLVAKLGSQVRLLGKLPQARLPQVYRNADVFVFPTIEDGFALVLAQAKAAGLPIITTPNSAGPDLLQHGIDGWIVPIRDPDAIVRQLRWCAANRSALADMVTHTGTAALRGWAEVAKDFERVCDPGARAEYPKVATHVR